MDPKHSSEMFEHLEKQQEVLMEAYRTLSLELHNLQIEEEMLMRKFYEFMCAKGLAKKGEKKQASCTESSGEEQEGPLNEDSNAERTQSAH